MFEDEASLSNTATVSYGWSEKGRQPQITQIQRKRERKTIFGCVNPKSGEVVAQASDRGNTKTFFSFMLKVVKANPGKKVFMVLDNVRYHHAKRLKTILKRYAHRIELVFLPPYSPDLNCMERVWWFMRKKITHNRFVNTMNERIANFETFIADFREPNQQGQSLCNLCEIIY